MTNEERITACMMRLKYYGWDEIADELGYNPTTVREDLFKHVFHHRRKGNHGFGLYPAIKAWSQREQVGLTDFSEKMGYTKYYVSMVLNNRSPMTEVFLDRLCEVTGLAREEIFITEKEKVPR